MYKKYGEQRQKEKKISIITLPPVQREIEKTGFTYTETI